MQIRINVELPFVYPTLALGLCIEGFAQHFNPKVTEIMRISTNSSFGVISWDIYFHNHISRNCGVDIFCKISPGRTI